MSLMVLLFERWKFFIKNIIWKRHTRTHAQYTHILTERKTIVRKKKKAKAVAASGRVVEYHGFETESEKNVNQEKRKDCQQAK